MTATATRPTLPDHPHIGTIEEAQVKFVGLGTGFEGLDVQPIYLDVGDGDVYFVLRATAAESPSAKPGKGEKGRPVWLNRLKVESMAPIPEDLAKRVLAEHKETVQRMRDEIAGQLSLDAEAEAAEAEKLDKTGTAAEVADLAKRRAGGQPG